MINRKINKKILLLKLQILLLFLLTLSLFALDSYKTIADLNLRNGPGAKYKSIGSIKNGKTVNVVGKNSQLWFKVEYNGLTGYLSSKYLIPVIIEPVKPESTNNDSYLFYLTGIIVVVIVLILFFADKTKPNAQVNKSPGNAVKDEKELREELVKTILNNITVTVSSSNSFHGDDSIIDVSNRTYNIAPQPALTKYSGGVPFWQHYYVYSHTGIADASLEQKQFYVLFKNKFIEQEYLDLDGNNNYAFILLFDLLNEYESHKDINKLEKQLDALGQYYPKTRSYGYSHLIQKMSLIGDIEGISRLRGKENDRYHERNNYGTYDPNEFRLGNKYKDTLKLSEQEVGWLNKFWNPNNVFLSIDGCCSATIRLYLTVLKEVSTELESKNTSFTKEVDYLKEQINNIRKSNNNAYWNEYENIFMNDQAESEIYHTIFKRIENCVRDAYGHKRKISRDLSYPSLTQEFDKRIGNSIDHFLEKKNYPINPPDEETEIELNFQNVNRWKNKFERLCSEYSETNKNNFIEEIYTLEKYNKKNSNIENIFFEASKFIAKYDKIESLKFYIYYLKYDLKSAKIDNKQHSKTIQKTLFSNNDQLRTFEIIISEYVNDKNIKKAIKNIPQVYQIKRKKIQLDDSLIKEVKEKHTGTVDLLNEYLSDEYESETNSVKSQEVNNEEIKIEIITKGELTPISTYKDEINITSIQEAVLNIFVKNQFTLLQKELDAYAKSEGMFKNQLVESINESCYEYLEDVLIEEDQENYVLNKNYYQRILNNDR